ncbi:MAG: tetratricopeptide repeat protein [Cyanobacteriota bacterium]|nr:tetratricopeptide repeat protein [Cyanobacteriota bacterium]
MSSQPTSPISTYLAKAQDLNDRNQLTEAIALYEEAIEFYPDNAKLFCALGIVREKQGDIEEAIASYRQAIELDPQQQTWLYLALGQLLTDREQLDEAIATYEAGLQVYPDNLKLHQSLGTVAEQTGEIDRAIAQYQRAIELNPKQPTWVYFTLARLFKERDQFDDAIATYQTALEVYPDNAKLYPSLAIVTEQNGDIDGAIAYHSRGIELNPGQQTWVYLTLGRLLTEQDQLDEASANYQAALKIHPENAKLYQSLGVLAQKKEDPDGVIENYQRALELDPQQPPWVYFTLAEFLVQRSKFDESIAIHQTAVERYPENPEAYRLLGTSQNQAHQLEAAIDSYRQAIALDPDSAIWVYLTLGQLLQEQDDIEGAIALYKAASERHPDNADLQRELGWAQKKMEMSKPKSPPTSAA